MHTDYESLKVAAEWYAVLQDTDVSPRQRASWQRWLEARPEHRHAWSHIEAVSQRFAPLRGDGERIAAEQAMKVASHRPRSRRQAIALGLALGGTGLVGWLSWRYTPLPSVVTAWRSDYATGIGEQRDIVLSDNTRIWLNTRSAIDVDFDASRRQVRLANGEILIETGGDTGLTRPFFVETRDGQLQALGTRFTVQQMTDHVRLVVYDGQVRIRNLAGQEALVRAGEQRRYGANSISVATPADPARQAWARGVILAENLPLRDLIAELGRYHAGYIGVDPRIADLRVVGRYPADDMKRTLAMLERDLPIHVHRTFAWWVTIDPR